MDAKEIIADELRAAGYEVQIKFRATLPESSLLALRARKVGTVTHEDRFFVRRGTRYDEAKELVRLRREGEDDLLFTFKGPVANRKLRNRLVVHKIAAPADVAAIRKSYDEVIAVTKRRTIFLLDGVRIALDRVDRLGDFVELEVERASDARLVHRLARSLGIDERTSTRRSYFELALLELRPLHRLLFKLHDRFGRFTFGVSSAVMTTMGVVASLDAATASRAAVLGGIVSIAVADSVSDAFGIFSAKKAERGVSVATALRSALGTLWGKAAIAATFLLPFVLLPNPAAIYAAVVWGAALLVLVSAQIAFVKEESFWKNTLGNLAVAALIVALARFVGGLVGGL